MPTIINTDLLCTSVDTNLLILTEQSSNYGFWNTKEMSGLDSQYNKIDALVNQRPVPFNDAVTIYDN